MVPRPSLLLSLNLEKLIILAELGALLCDRNRDLPSRRSPEIVPEVARTAVQWKLGDGTD